MAINFPIVTTFDDKATKKADKAFSTLGRKFAAVFSVAAVVKFGKASVKAFNDSQREAALLATQLNAVNLGFASPFINEFIDKLELASGLAGKELSNAFISLSQATGDVTTAQKILTTALDVSLGTGKSLQTVSVALQRAYKGETTALARLRIGYTTAELKGKKFDEVLEDLQNRFDGAAGRAVDTFAGKMARLSAAVEQAQEAFGEGLVSGIEQSDMSIEDLQKSIVGLGKALGDLTATVVDFGKTTIDVFGDIKNSSAVQGVLNVFEALVRGAGFIITGELVPTMDSASARLAAQQRRKAEEQNRAKLRTQNQLNKAEKQNAAQKLASEKKITAEKKKQNTESKIIDEINKRFEMDRIQIAAALGGQINDVERLRLELMRALLDEDVKRAIILEGQLIKAEAEAKELALLLDSLDEMVGDPFADWPGTITRIKELLKTLNIKIPIETLFAEKGLKLDQEKMTVTKLDRMDVNANNVYINGALQGAAIPNAISGGGSTAALSKEVVAAFLAGDPEVIAAVENNALANAALADAELMLAEALLAESGGGDTNITVIVEGSVIAVEDLAESITDIQYEYQRSGKSPLFSSIAI